MGRLFPAGVNGNDRLKVIVGSPQRQIRIPRLEPQIDRVGNTIEGRARPDDVVFALITHMVSFRTTTDHTLAFQANGDGRYMFDTTGEVKQRRTRSTPIGWQAASPATRSSACRSAPCRATRPTMSSPADA